MKTHALAAALVMATFSGCDSTSKKRELDGGVQDVAAPDLTIPGLDVVAPPQWPNDDDGTTKLIGHLTGPSIDHIDWANARASAIDILGERKSVEAIPALIECLSDPRSLLGSDHSVAGHAAAALSEITGRPFSIDQKEWKEWWATRGSQFHPEW